MDATAMALRRPPSCSSSVHHPSSLKDSRILCGSVHTGRRRPEIEILKSGFCDRSHLQYYNSDFGCCSSAGRKIVMIGKQEKSGKDKSVKKMKKKQSKLLKGLTRDLSTFSQIGFALDSDGALLDQVKGNMISEAAELLLEQLQKIRADEKELKRKMKEEKARLKAAARMQNSVDCEVSSSGSSSESSDSECGEVVDMNKLKHANATQIGSQQVIEEAASTDATPNIPAVTLFQPNASDAKPVPLLPSTSIPEEKIMLQISSSIDADMRTDNLGEMSLSRSCSATPTCSKKIEVCMGGKCKKSGGGALLEEFQRVVGNEGAVSGCKCMGKCRDGPNVKVVNGVDGGVADNTVRMPANSFCIGVGLEDVNTIVANFLGENLNQLGFAAAT